MIFLRRVVDLGGLLLPTSEKALKPQGRGSSWASLPLKGSFSITIGVAHRIGVLNRKFTTALLELPSFDVRYEGLVKQSDLKPILFELESGAKQVQFQINVHVLGKKTKQTLQGRYLPRYHLYI